MLQVCGRFQIPVDEMWNMTPSEFNEVIKGSKQRERVQRLGFASIVSVVMSLAGNPISAEALIGEKKDYGPSPFDDDDKASMMSDRRKMIEDLRAKREADAHRAWMPKGIDLSE